MLSVRPRCLCTTVWSPWQQELRSSASRISIQSRSMIGVMSFVVSLLCRLIRMVCHRWIVFFLAFIDDFRLKSTNQLRDSSIVAHRFPAVWRCRYCIAHVVAATVLEILTMRNLSNRVAMLASLKPMICTVLFNSSSIRTHLLSRTRMR